MSPPKLNMNADLKEQQRPQIEDDQPACEKSSKTEETPVSSSSAPISAPNVVSTPEEEVAE